MGSLLLLLLFFLLVPVLLVLVGVGIPALRMLWKLKQASNPQQSTHRATSTDAPTQDKHLRKMDKSKAVDVSYEEVK